MTTAPYKPSGTPVRTPYPIPATKRLLGLTISIYRALLKTFLNWKLRKEGRDTMRSFFAVSEALGLDPYSSKQPESQQARLKRVHAIKQELTVLNYSHLSNTRP